MDTNTSAKDYFDGKSIFITGATGYVGRFLIYKLLKDFDIKNIYTVLRPKRGKKFEERSLDFKNSELFEFLPSKKYLDKIVTLSGDICEVDCGLSEEDKSVLKKEVDIVIHSAASIRFTEPLKSSCVTHIEGTHNVVELAAQMDNVQMFLHVSSFAAWVNNETLTETVPNCKYDPYKVAAEFRGYTAEEAREKEKEYIGDMPKFLNSYSVTKTLAEVVVSRSKHRFKRVAIVRPPFLVSSNSEPKVGWFDEPQDGVALSALFSLGLLRLSNIDIHTKIDAVPVDVCANALLGVIVHMSNDPATDSNMKVFNLALRNTVDCTAYDLMPVAIQLGYKYPSMKQIRPPSHLIHHNESNLYIEIKSFITHTLFSLLIDFILIILGRKPLLYQLTSKKISAVKKTFQRITEYRSKYTIESKNMDLLYGEKGSLSKEDRSLIPYDLQKCDWYKIAEQGHLNFRRKVLKERDETLPLARKRLFVISRIYNIFTFFLQLGLLYALYNVNLLLMHQVPWLWPGVILSFGYLLFVILAGDSRSYIRLDRA